MITELRLGNFKAFAEAQSIPIRPITLIFGANSAGKSSLIHGLLLAHHALEKGELDVHRTTIGGESVDLGGFKQYVFKRDITRQVEWSIGLDATSFSGRLSELFGQCKKVSVTVTIGMGKKKYFMGREFEGPLDDSELSGLHLAEDAQFYDIMEIYQVHDRVEKYRDQYFTTADFLKLMWEPQIRSYRIEIDSRLLLKMSIGKWRSLQLDILDNDHPAFKQIAESLLLMATTTEKVTAEDHEALKEAIAEMVPKITSDLVRFLPTGIKIAEEQRISKEPLALMPVRKGYRQEDLRSALQLYLPRILDEIIQELTKTVSYQLNQLHYLGPLRSYPPRHLLQSQHHDTNWYAGGGYAWDEIRRDSELRKKINEWLGDPNKLTTPYELVVQHLQTIDNLEKHYLKIIERIEAKWFDNKDEDEPASVSKEDYGELFQVLNYLKANEQEFTDIRELVLRDKRTDTVVSHRDVGIGVSQVLPVLVSAYGSKGQIIAIEQPEIYLHPALQAELGDVFIESALGERKNTLLIETHSEHLILRILKRIRETTEGELPPGQIPVRPNDVQVVYAKPTNQGTILHDIGISEDGEFLEKWPDGFFPERAKELF